MRRPYRALTHLATSADAVDARELRARRDVRPVRNDGSENSGNRRPEGPQPKKNSRWTSQKVPAAITPAEPHSVTRRRARADRAAIQASAGATASTIASWPSSTPRLNANSDQPRAARGNPN